MSVKLNFSKPLTAGPKKFAESEEWKVVEKKKGRLWVTGIWNSYVSL